MLSPLLIFSVLGKSDGDFALYFLPGGFQSLASILLLFQSFLKFFLKFSLLFFFYILLSRFQGPHEFFKLCQVHFRAVLLFIMGIRGVRPATEPALKPLVNGPLRRYQIRGLRCLLVFIKCFDSLDLFSDPAHFLFDLLQIHISNFRFCDPLYSGFEQLPLVFFKLKNFCERLR